MSCFSHKIFFFWIFLVCMENAFAGTTTTTTKNHTNFPQKYSGHSEFKNLNRSLTSQRKLTKEMEFAGRTLNYFIGQISQIFGGGSVSGSASGSKNLTLDLSGLMVPNLSDLSNSLTDAINGFILNIPLYVGLPIGIVATVILLKAIAFAVAIIPSYTAPYYNKFSEQFDDFFSSDSSDGGGWGSPSGGYGAPSSSYGAPSSSYGAPSHSYASPSNSYAVPSDSYTSPKGNSRVSHERTPQTPQLAPQYQPGPSSSKLNAMTHQFNQAVQQYSQK